MIYLHVSRKIWNFATKLRITGILNSMFSPPKWESVSVCTTYLCNLTNAFTGNDTMGRMPLFHKIISTGFGSGYCPVAPGTAGALLATVVWLAYSSLTDDYPTTMAITAGLVIVFTILGIWSSGISEAYWGKDPRRVVVDEMVGVWIALLAAPANAHYGYAVAAFVLFRFFDIAKPLGIRQMERLPKGIGIMADDILAGIYSAVVILIYRWAYA